MNKTKPIMALYGIAFLALCCIATLATFVVRADKLTPDAHGLLPFLSGKVVASFEKKFEENLVIRDQMVGIWGAVQYGIFKSGGKKVVVGTNDWLFTTEEFEHPENAGAAEKRLLAVAAKLKNYLAANNIELIVALVPAKARIYPEYLGRHHMPAARQNLYARTHSALTQAGIAVPDLAQIFISHKDTQPLYLRLDTHWTPAGALLAAETIAGIARGMTLEKATFKTSTGVPTPTDGDLEKYIKTGPLSPWLSPAPDMVTQATTEKEPRGDLFADEIISVALIGTSYSAIDKWNFEGALKTALQADVLNLADEGQGPLEPLAKFLKDTDISKTKIRLVIWEIPERFITTSYDDVVFPDFIEGAQ